MLPFNNFKIYLNDKAGLTDEEMLQLPYIPKSKQLKKGQTLLDKGRICKDIFFVEKGLLRQFTIDDQGKEHIIHFAPGPKGKAYAKFRSMEEVKAHKGNLQKVVKEWVKLMNV